MVTILLELLALLCLVAFAVIIWWPSALLVVAVSAGFVAWNRERGVKR